jgi:phosphoenolpyruvate-protein phosphotransferase (PTS system enzyme I)
MKLARYTTRNRAEERWHGLSVSEGFAIGRVLRLYSGTRHVYRALLKPSDIEREVRRLRAAIRLTRRQTQATKERAEKELGSAHAYIFDAHLLMLEDPKLIEDVESLIRNDHVNAEWAVKVVADRMLAVYSSIKDEYLRERSSDLQDVTHRILAVLSGEPANHSHLTEEAILVAEDIFPSAVAELDLNQVRAIATDAGGWTSHTAIIARGLGIPAIVGLRDLYRHARTGDIIAVDAFKGEIVLNPADETIEEFQVAEKHFKESRKPSNNTIHDGGPLRTLDGVEIILRANLELPAEYVGVNQYGARGIGLYRSEFLLTHHGTLPSEDEQYATYVKLLEIANGDEVTIRLFDLGGDKLGLDSTEPEPNPALGLRGIRFCLSYTEILRTQIRSVLRASTTGKLNIVLPMVSDISDVRRAKQLIDDESKALVKEGYTIGNIKVGAMVEVPSAVIMADKLIHEVDFFSLGTNDLVQYLLAVDRSNGNVADWFRSLHPAVLQSIHRTINIAHTAFRPVIICGEMAATPAYAVILVGLGATELSMTASSIPRLKQTLSEIKAETARSIATECLECSTSDDVEEIVRQRLGTTWPHLFPAKSLPAPKVTP